MTIPNASSDRAPAAAVFRNRIYVAYKEPGNTGLIHLASSDDPFNPSSWDVQPLSCNLPEPGPVQMRTDSSPELAVFNNRLYLSFKGHNNPLIWLASMDSRGRWRGHGYAANVQTSKGPAMSGSLAAHKGRDRDNRIWYFYHNRRDADRVIPGATTRTAPALARWEAAENGHQALVFIDPEDKVKATRQYLDRTEGPDRLTWTEPIELHGAEGAGRPALTAHDNKIVLAFKDKNPRRYYGIYAGNGLSDFSRWRRRASKSIWMASYNGKGWILHGRLPRINSAFSPALVSFENNLIIFYIDAEEENQIRCRQTALPGYPIPLHVMTVNIRVDEDDSPNTWGERAARLRDMIIDRERGIMPDIIAMQEVEGNMLQDMKDNYLSHYGFYARERGGPAVWNPHEGLAILYATNRLAETERGWQTISHRQRRERGGCSDTYISTGSRDHSDRIILWVRFQDLATNRSFYVYNVHIGGKDDCEKRGNAQLLEEMIANRSRQQDPVIVMGDLNFGQQAGRPEENQYNPLFVNLTTNLGMENAYRRIHPENLPHEYTTVNTYYPGDHHNQMIDFILVSPSIQVRDAQVDRSMFTADGRRVECRRIRRRRCMGNDAYRIEDMRMYSDHWAVWAELVWMP